MTRPHNCLEFIDVRFHGADDHEGETYCVVCKTPYSADELSEMHAAIQADEPQARRAAA